MAAGFYHFNFSNFNLEQKKGFRYFQNALTKFHIKKSQKNFLSNCLKEQVTPRTLRFTARNPEGPFSTIEKNIIEDRIGSCRQEIEAAAKTKRFAYNGLQFLFSPFIKNKLVDFAHDTSRFKIRAHERTLENKLNKLCEESMWNKYSNLDSIVNLSSKNLNANEKSVLGLGLSFNLEPDATNVLDSIVQVDKLIRRGKYDNQEGNYIRGLIPPMLLSYKKDKPVLPDRFKKALKGLQSDRSIKVLPADKGGKTVIMDLIDYENKAFNLLSDSNTYVELKKDPTADVNSLIRKKINSHLKSHPDFEEIKKKLIRPNFSSPYFYGLAKIHKPGIPLRPVISTVGAATRPLAGWLAGILSKYVGTFSSAHIRNNVDFKNRLIEFQRENAISNTKMLSFDVKALFTNVPINTVLNFIDRKIDEGCISTPIPRNDFMSLVKVCVENSSFQFKHKFYKQKFGMAMGSPLSPILANIFMEYFETELMENIQNKPLMWVRYVDDVWAIMDKEADHLGLLNEINALSPTIKFTCEMEKDGELPFLDCRVKNSEGTYHFDIYRKPTDAGMHLHSFSNHQNQVKKSVLFSLFLRAYRICDRNLLNNELSKLYEIFKKLGYSNQFIHKVHGDVKRKHYARNSNQSTNEPRQFPPNHIVLPLNSYAETYIKPVLKSRECSVHFKASNTIKRKLVSNRPKIDNMNEAPGVYMIPCSVCPQSYFGETGRSFKIRLREHQSQVTRNNDEKSAVADHCVQTGHPADWRKSRLIYKSFDWYERVIVESVVISETSSRNYNRKDGLRVIDRATRNQILDALPKIKKELYPNG